TVDRVAPERRRASETGVQRDRNSPGGPWPQNNAAPKMTRCTNRELTGFPVLYLPSEMHGKARRPNGYAFHVPACGGLYEGARRVWGKRRLRAGAAETYSAPGESLKSARGCLYTLAS